VAFVVDKNMKRNVLDFKAVDERIYILKIKTKFHNQTFINVHSPTKEKDGIEKEALCQKMEEAYDISPPNYIKPLLGD
jgi:hypothetical protein